MDTHAVAGNAAIDTLHNGWSGDDGGWDVVPADPWEVYTSVERESGLFSFFIEYLSTIDKTSTTNHPK